MKARSRELLRAAPFQPFIIRMADGRWFKIEDPAYVMASPKGHSDVIVEETADRMHYLPVAMIVNVET